MFNNGWIAQVQLNYNQQNGQMISWPMRCWLMSTMDNEYTNWYYDDSLNRIFFRNKEDKVMFILQWM